MKHQNKAVKMTLASVLAVAGCSVGATEEAYDDAAPSVDLDNVEEQQLITNANGDGTWTATASASNTGWEQWADVKAWATFTGPAGKTRKMGVCLLKKYLPQKSCTAGVDGAPTNGSCDTAPSYLPTGWNRYCLAPNGSGTKYCYTRPGTSQDYCAGSPANGGTPVAPGTYNTRTWQTGFNEVWLGYACFEACASIAGSVSPNANMN